MKIYPTLLLLSFLSAMVRLAGDEPNQSKPNIVLILLDNFGYGEIGVYGGGARRGAPTTRIDSLARDGMKLTNFNTEPVCTASRSALLTGRFPIRSGTYGIARGLNGSLTQWEITLAEMLHDAGYATAAIGKWHLGDIPGRFPTDQGFDEWYGIPRSNEESMLVPPTTHTLEGRKGSKISEVEIYDRRMRSEFDGEITRRAIDFMKRQVEADRPFFAYLPMTTGHIPTIPSPQWNGKTGNGRWADVLAQLDHYVGQLLDAVKALGIEGDTVFIFTADNGAESWLEYGNPPGTDSGANRGWPGPWRGSYGTAMEGGLRVPFLIRWPGKIPAGLESDEIVHLVDIFPTLARIGGGKIPTDRAIDGVDQLDFLLGKQEKSNRDSFPIYDPLAGQLLAVKWKHWKLHFHEKVLLEDNYKEMTAPHPMLVNLFVDPMEERFMAPVDAAVLAAINARIAEFQASLDKYPPIKVGTPDPYKP